MKRPTFLCVLTVAGLDMAGCTQFPELDHTQTDRLENTDYPTLIPLEPLLTRADAPGPDLIQTNAEVTSRIAGLRARASAMRGSVLSGAEKKRLAEGLR